MTQPKRQSDSESTPGPDAEAMNLPGIFGLLLAMIGVGLGMCMPPFALISTLGLLLAGYGLTLQPRGIAVAGVAVGLFGTLFGLISFTLGI